MKETARVMCCTEAEIEQRLKVYTTKSDKLLNGIETLIKNGHANNSPDIRRLQLELQATENKSKEWRYGLLRYL